MWLVWSPGTVYHCTFVPHLHYQRLKTCSRHIFSRVPTSLTNCFAEYEQRTLYGAFAVTLAMLLRPTNCRFITTTTATTGITIPGQSEYDLILTLSPTLILTPSPYLNPYPVVRGLWFANWLPLPLLCYCVLQQSRGRSSLQFARWSPAHRFSSP